MNLLTLSILVHDKETAVRFLQNHGVILAVICTGEFLFVWCQVT